MKVTAKHWVCHNGVWYQAGETYDDGIPEIAENTSEIPETTPEPEQPKKPTRKRTTKEK